MTLWLALDLGSTGVRAVLMESSGKILRSAYRTYPTETSGERLEQRVGDWRRAAQDAALELRPHDAEAVALTGQMQDVILVDEAGEGVRPVILYSDARADSQAARLQQSDGELLRELTGNEQGPASVLAKLHWLAEHEPASLSRAAHLLLGAADYLALVLANVAATDTTTASTTGLLELTGRRWLTRPEWLVPQAERLLPKLVPGGTRVGAVQPVAAAAFGLRPGIPVHLGPGDAGATSLGAGGGVPRRPYAYLGTSGWVAFTAPARAESSANLFHLAHPDPGLFICVAPLLTAGGNLDWLLEIFGRQHQEAIAAACDRPPSRLIYLPYLKGERSPLNDPDARAAFIGLAAHHTRDDLLRSVLEGVAFAYKHALDALMAEPLERLTLIGGGARSAPLCQLLADVAEVPVVVPTDAAHIGLRGAVLAACGESGAFELGLDGATTFAPRADSLLRQKFVLFREAYPALRELFAAMSRLELA